MWDQIISGRSWCIKKHFVLEDYNMKGKNKYTEQKTLGNVNSVVWNSLFVISTEFHSLRVLNIWQIFERPVPEQYFVYSVDGSVLGIWSAV